MSLDGEQSLDQVLDLAFAGESQTAPNEFAQAMWICGLALAEAALSRSNGFTRERLLRNVEDEMRADLKATAARVAQRTN